MIAAILLICVWSLGSVSSAQPQLGNPLITEILPNQTGDLETEWIELYNPTGLAIDLQNYRIGDELGWRDISDTVLILPSQVYVVLAQDVSRFLEYYLDYEGTISAPVGWQILNNDGDRVRLADAFGVTIDSFIYDHSFPDNRSWERYIDNEGDSHWGGSFDPSGSTPGRENTFFYPRTASIDISVTPDPFSPDGNGFEDQTLISFNPPEGNSFELRVYDISGRNVRTFFDGRLPIPGEVLWDGRTDDGSELPAGIYILFARVAGEVEAATKKTIVIAR